MNTLEKEVKRTSLPWFYSRDRPKIKASKGIFQFELYPQGLFPRDNKYKCAYEGGPGVSSLNEHSISGQAEADTQEEAIELAKAVCERHYTKKQYIGNSS